MWQAAERTALIAELSAELRGELKKELKKEVKAELRGEMRGGVKAELRGELKAQVEAHVRGGGKVKERRRADKDELSNPDGGSDPPSGKLPGAHNGGSDDEEEATDLEGGDSTLEQDLEREIAQSRAAVAALQRRLRARRRAAELEMGPPRRASRNRGFSGDGLSGGARGDLRARWQEKQREKQASSHTFPPYVTLPFFSL